MELSAHHIYMARCLELARKGSGHTAPNPMVGAVLVHQGRIIGEGYHRVYGQAHAEVNCFDSVQDEDKHLVPESILYVSLEPCAHFGKTPPCAHRIVKEGVRSVVICNQDPFDQVDGKGIRVLQDHGVEVHSGIMEEEGAWLNRRFFTFHRQKRPYIILKWAQTANGFFAPADRSRFQMSDEYSVRLSHRWRREEAAIMVGYTTALQDNPQLTDRYGNGPQPLRIALDKDLRLPVTHYLLSDGIPSWIINQCKDVPEGQPAYVRLPFDDILLPRLLSRLYEAGKLSLIVEGGATLLQHFMDAGLWDEARVFTSPALMEKGVPAPVFRQGREAITAGLMADNLSLWINEQNPYAYSFRAFPVL